MKGLSCLLTLSHKVRTLDMRMALVRPSKAPYQCRIHAPWALAVSRDVLWYTEHLDIQ
jgi:hypothetical protein